MHCYYVKQLVHFIIGLNGSLDPLRLIALVSQYCCWHRQIPLTLELIVTIFEAHAHTGAFWSLYLFLLHDDFRTMC